MATPGDTLLVGIGVDLPSLGRDTERAVKYFASFQKQVSRLINNAQFVGDLGSQGRKAAASLLAGVTTTFDRRRAQIREDFARGLINEQKFKLEGTKAAEAFNASLSAGMTQLDGKKLLPAGIRQALTDEFKSIGKSSADQLAEQIQQRFTRFGSGLSALGRGLTVGVTAPVVAIGTAAFAAFSAVDEGLDTIRIGTGKTGAALAGLEADFRALFQTVPSSAADVAAALVAVNRQSGATGVQLQNIARAQLTFARLTKTDLNTALTESVGLFQQFGIAANDQVATLDFLFAVVQRTGGTLGGLAASLNRVGPTLRQFGFSFKQSAALAALFEKSGLDVVTTVNAMRTAMPKLVRASGDASGALRSLIEQIKAAKSNSAAVELASQVFGRGGAGTFVAAVREGRFAYAELLSTIAGTPDSLAAAAKATDGIAERLDVLKHRAQVALEPLGARMIEVFERAQPTFVRLIETVAGLVESFSRLSPATQEFIIKAAIIGAAVGPAATAIGSMVGGLGSLAGALLSGTAKAKVFAVAARGIGLLLSPGGLVLGGLAGLATAMIWASRKTQDTTTDLLLLRGALAQVSNNKLLSQSLVALGQDYDVVLARINAIKKAGQATITIRRGTGPGGVSTEIIRNPALVEQERQLNLIKEQITEINSRWRENSEATITAATEARKTADAIKAALGSGAVVNFDTTASLKALDALKARADALRQAYDDIAKGAAPIPELTPAILATYDKASAILANQKDQWGEVAEKARDAIRKLRETEPVAVLRELKTIPMTIVPLIDKTPLRVPMEPVFTNIPAMDVKANVIGLDALKFPTTLAPKLQVPGLAGLKLPPIKIDVKQTAVQVSALESAVGSAVVTMDKAARAVEAFANTTGAGHGIVTKFLQEFAKGTAGVARALAELSIRLPRALSFAADGVLLFARGVTAAARGTVAAFANIGRSLLDAINPVVIVGQFFADAFGGLGDVFAKLKGPLSALSKILAEALAPIVDALIPVFRAILPVLRAFLQVLTPIIIALIPIFQALVPLLEAVFPIIKAVAIAFTYLAQAALTVGAVILDVFSFVARGFGYIIKGIATAIDKLPGVSAKGAIRAGQAIVDFGVGLGKSADEFRKSAKAMAGARDAIRKTRIGGPIEESSEETADAVDALGDAARDTTAALLNIPQGFKVERLRFRSAMAELVKSITTSPVQVPVSLPPVPVVRPVPVGTGTGGTGTTPAERSRAPVTLAFGNVNITTPSADGRTVYRAFFDEVTRLARQSGEEAQLAVLSLPRPA